jgi:hypothetical protein
MPMCPIGNNPEGIYLRQQLYAHRAAIIHCRNVAPTFGDRWGRGLKIGAVAPGDEERSRFYYAAVLTNINILQHR